ncbi:PEP/pyruvate-binding domain-containing protein [Pseudooceanicola atlanticus]|nr:PEP/pyruvate-binding domain-containing protein [Pseudooceanicola atlanticus]
MTRWTTKLDGSDLPDKLLIGGKGWSVARMAALGLTVPPAFVITTEACTEYRRTKDFPDGLIDEIAEGLSWLEAQTGRTYGHGPSPLLVSVRSGAAISMPGMMDTVLNMGICGETETALTEECGDPAFARDTHRRFHELYSHIVLKTDAGELSNDDTAQDWAETIRAASGKDLPADPTDRLHAAVRAVFESWDSRRAKRYRKHHDISDDLGTAVVIQAMVFGNMSGASGTGVMFSRNPIDGNPTPYGEYLVNAQGEDVVSGKFTPRPLDTMRDTVPEAHDALLDGARRL